MDICFKELLYYVFQAVAFIMWLVGLLLDAIINFTIIEFKNLTGDATKLAWTSFRDLANITFIFTLLFISIKLVLNDSGPFKNLLPKLIVAALLINFSYTITGILIDLSNNLSLEFYSSLTEGTEDDSVSSKMLKAFGVQEFFDPKTGDGANESTATSAAFASKYNIGAILGMIMFTIVAICVITTMCVLLIARAVVFVFALILSALYFIGSFVPQVGSATKRWKDSFVGELISVPILFLFLVICINMIENLQGDLGALPAANETLGAKGIEPFMNIAVVSALLFGSIIISKQLGASGSGMANNILKRARRMSLGALKRGGGMITKPVVSGAGRITGRAWDATARQGQRIGAKLSNTRIGKFVKENEKAVGTTAAVLTLGLSKIIPTVVQDTERNVRGVLKNIENAKMGTKTTVEEDRKAREKRSGELSSKIKIMDAQNGIKNELKGDSPDLAKLKTFIGSLNMGQLAEMDKNVLTNKYFAASMSTKQIEDLSKRDEFKDDLDFQKQMSDARIKGITESIGKMDDQQLLEFTKSNRTIHEDLGKIHDSLESNGNGAGMEKLKTMFAKMSPSMLRKIEENNSENRKMKQQIVLAVREQGNVGNQSWITGEKGEQHYGEYVTPDFKARVQERRQVDRTQTPPVQQNMGGDGI